MQILALLGAGRTFDEAYGAVTGRVWVEFARSVPARLRALAVAPESPSLPTSFAGAGANGPTFVVYGYQPSSSSPSRSAATRQVLEHGFSRPAMIRRVLESTGTAWPADTYTFTVTSGSAPPSPARSRRRRSCP